MKFVGVLTKGKENNRKINEINLAALLHCLLIEASFLKWCYEILYLILLSFSPGAFLFITFFPDQAEKLLALAPGS